MKGENCVNKLMPRFSYRIVTIICGALLLSGCVMAEKYDAEKARSLNFQRLLAQEEKRTGELDSEVKRSKNELMEYEARNRELAAQLQATRDQLARVQEESEAMKEFAQLERKAKTDMKRGLKSTRKAVPVEPTSDAVDLSAPALGIAPDGAAVPEGIRIFDGKHAVARRSCREAWGNALSDQPAAWRLSRQDQKVEQTAGRHYRGRTEAHRGPRIIGRPRGPAAILTQSRPISAVCRRG